MLQRVFLLLTLCSIIINAQDQPENRYRGSITGSVINAVTREPLMGANVVVMNTVFGAATNSEGRFSIVNVPVGTYNLQVSMIGFSPSIQTDIVVSTGRPADVRFTLNETEVELEGVTITAGFFQKIPGQPMSTQSQSREEIRRLPGGFEDVVRAISILPGVAFVQAGRNDLIVRGGAPTENLFIIENIEVPNINHFGTQGATGGPQSFINLDFISNTTFSTGGFGVQYGDRLSSTLQIDLREGRSDALGGKATVSATQFGLNLEGPVDDSGTFFISARRSYLDLIFRAAGFSFVPEYWDFLGKIDYRLSRNNRLTVLGVGALNNVRIFNETDDNRFDNSRILYSNQNQYIGGVTWQRLFKSGYSTVTFGQTYVDYAYRQDDFELNPVFLNDSYEYESTLRADFVIQLSSRAEVAAGMQGKIARVRTDMFLRSFNTSFGDELSKDIDIGVTGYKSAAYLQLTRRLGSFTLTGGLRADRFSLIDEPISLSPRISAVYALTDRINLNLALGKYYQAPSYIWIAANAVNRGLTFVGADQYITGIEFLPRNDTKLSLEGYYKNYFNYPVSLTRPYLVMSNTGAGYGGSEEGFASFGIDPLVSEGTGRAFGAELFLQKKLSEIPFYGTFSISYNNAEFKALDGISRSSRYDQRWIINLGGGYICCANWEFSARFRYATGRPYTPYQPDGTQNPELYHSRRIPENHSLDIRADRRWAFDKWALIVYVDIQNIYNRPFRDVPRFNQRDGIIEHPRSIGILPSIGFSAEF